MGNDSSFQLRTLLIVDDEPDILEILKFEVESWGIRAKSASHIVMAQKLLETEHFTAVLSDISMPGGTGLDLLRRVRAQGNNIPFLILTAFDSRDLILQALKLDAFDFLQKPFEKDQLKESVLKVIDIGIRQFENDQDSRSGTSSNRNLRNQKMINLLKVKNSGVPIKKS